MNEAASPALRTALAYYQAWTSHDLDQAMRYISDGDVRTLIDRVGSLPAARACTLIAQAASALDSRELMTGLPPHTGRRTRRRISCRPPLA